MKFITINFKRVMFLALLLLTLSVSAKKRRSSNYFYEFSVEPCMSIVAGTSADAYGYEDFGTRSFTPGINAGGAFGFRLSNSLSASIGLLYSKAGQNYNDFTMDMAGSIQGSGMLFSKYTVSQKLSLNYVKIPIVLNYATAPRQPVSFAASAGVYIGTCLSYRSEYGVYYYQDSEIVSEMSYVATGNSLTLDSRVFDYQLSDEATFANGKPFKTIDYGVITSAGLHFNISRNIAIPLMLSYSLGLSNIINADCQIKATDNSGATESYWYQGEGASSFSQHNSSVGVKVGVRVSF